MSFEPFTGRVIKLEVELQKILESEGEKMGLKNFEGFKCRFSRNNNLVCFSFAEGSLPQGKDRIELEKMTQIGRVFIFTEVHNGKILIAGVVKPWWIR